jgi:hypothetical protein
MPRPVSDDIYWLAKTLTHSEYQTLMDDAFRGIHSNTPKGQKPLYLQIVDLFRNQEEFSDDIAREHFGYEKGNSPEWRTAKKETIKLIERAIDRARSNQEEHVILGRIPARIENFIDKGIWERANASAEKYMGIAEQSAMYEDLLKLIKLKIRIVLATFSLVDAEKTLATLATLRAETREKLNSIELLFDIWAKLTLKARMDQLDGAESLSILLCQANEVHTIGLGDEADILIWKIRRRCNFLLRDTEGYIQVMQEGINAFEDHQGKTDKIFALLDWIVEYIRFLAGAHRFEEGQYYLARFDKIESELAQYKNRILAKKIRSNQFLAFAKVERDKIADSIDEFEKNYSLVKDQWSELELIKSVYFHVFSCFLLERFSDAVKWSYMLRIKKPSAAIARHIAFYWLFYLMIRVDQGETEIAKTEINATTKVIESIFNPEDIFVVVLNYIRCVLDGNEKGKNLLSEQIAMIYHTPNLQKNANFFPFDVWINSHQTSVSFFELFKARNKPFHNL